MKKTSLFLVMVLIAVISTYVQATTLRTETFDTGSGWVTTGSPQTSDSPAYGWYGTDNTAGTSPAGEVGGEMPGDLTYRVGYADTTIGTLSLADDLYASGEFIVTANGGDDVEQGFVGFYNKDSALFQNALGIVILDRGGNPVGKQRLKGWVTYSNNTETMLGTTRVITDNTAYTFVMTWTAATRVYNLDFYLSGSTTPLFNCTKTFSEAEVALMGTFNAFGMANCKDNWTKYSSYMGDNCGVTAYLDNATYTAPEPATLVLLFSGMMMFARKRK